MGSGVERVSFEPTGATGGLRLRLLGPMAILRDGTPMALPPSRKVRALLGYLALAPRPVLRERLCELMWDVPDDPRGELRWCLSKIRRLLDEPGAARVAASRDAVSLRLGDCQVDAAEIAAAIAAGIGTLGPDRLRALSGLFVGELLEGSEALRSPRFDLWLTSRRRHLHACRAAVIEHLVRCHPGADEEAMAHRTVWVAIAPFDVRAHAALLDALTAQGRLDDCKEHLAAAARLFASEDLDFEPVRAAWQAIMGRGPGAAASTAPAVVAPPDPACAAPAPRRASLAVMPFAREGSEDGVGGAAAHGLTHDIITRLAKLRSLFVIARGSVFALAERGVGPQDAAVRLGVDYVVGGTVRRRAGLVSVAVELAEARTARIVWAEAFDHAPGETFAVLDEIGDRIVSELAAEIEATECRRAVLKPPSSLDAWDAYHRGLWHLYRFTRGDNERAQHFFERSTALDPTFARPHAGLSFVHWQNAFQRWEDRGVEIRRALDAAGQSLLVDDHDPAAHLAMGRALWLGDRQAESVAELERSVDLSPNFALGHYSLAFVQSQSGDPEAAIASSEQSCRLSPFDPLLFGMLGARAMALARLGRLDEAADWAVKAAARPNAHAHILAIAACCLGLAGRPAEGRAFAEAVRATRPRYGVEDFLAAFHFAGPDAALFRRGAEGVGLA